MGRILNIYLLLTVIANFPRDTNGSCYITELPAENGLCAASLQCEKTLVFDRTLWDCIQSTVNEQDYNNYGYGRHYQTKTVYSDQYALYIKLLNVDDQQDILESVINPENIKSLTIDSGNILDIYPSFYHLTGTTEISISNIPILTVNLMNFAVLPDLTTIRFRNISLSTLDMDRDLKSPSSSVQTIDLSQNRLNAIPNNCFFVFTQMQHLNLSYNAIRTFDILTFEGVSKLLTLDVSFNMLFEIGNTFTRFVNLEELYLQNNRLTTLLDYNLSTLIKLKKLDLSSNSIHKFEINAFIYLMDLQYLDIRNNSIDIIPASLFRNNDYLNSLFISHNTITKIEDNAFLRKRITQFDVQGNRLSGNIKKETFYGIYVTDLNLSEGYITSIDNETFNYVCDVLKSLNMSHNKISSVPHSVFSCLEQLKDLDLSHNELNEINFEMSSLKNLTMLSFCSNNITKITKDIQKLTNLETLDLSYNEIVEIEKGSFQGLNNIGILKISHNPFVNFLEKNTFLGLNSMFQIDMSFTRTTSFQNESFSGLNNLNTLNASYGQLTSIGFNAFLGTGFINKLDLSHNLLESFQVNTSCIELIQEIYLNNNEIRYISNYSFSGLPLLRILNLVENNIQRIDTYAFKNSPELSHLYISSNTQMKIDGSLFNNLTKLFNLKLDNVKTGFTFQNASCKVENLDLHACGINDVSKLFLSNVTVTVLNLSDNDILKVDKFSFQSMPHLQNLDLSLNKISYLQPGSFLHVNSLKKLSLFGNNLQTLAFGVFDGLPELSYLNLSSNALQSFDAKLVKMHDMALSLDNNDIRELNFKEFFESGHRVRKLSIGGNTISCKTLLELKITHIPYFVTVLTAETLDFHSENVNGITCQSSPKPDSIFLPVVNQTGHDISPVFIKFTNSLEKLRSSIDVIGNNTSNEILVNSIKDLVNISNKTHTKTMDYFSKIQSIITNLTQSNLEVKKKLLNLTDSAKYLTSKIGLSDDKTIINNDKIDIRAEMKRMVKTEIDTIRDEFDRTLQNAKNQDNFKSATVVEKQSMDDRVLYFIAASLGIIIMLYVANLAYGFFKKTNGYNYNRTNSLHSSIRPMTCEMEME